MSFAVKVNGKIVLEEDVDHRLVESISIGSYRVPVAFADNEIALTVNVRSIRDAEVIADLQASAMEEYEKENEVVIEPPKEVQEAREEYAKTLSDPSVREEDERRREEESNADEHVDSDTADSNSGDTLDIPGVEGGEGTLEDAVPNPSTDTSAANLDPQTTVSGPVDPDFEISDPNEPKPSEG